MIILENYLSIPIINLYFIYLDYWSILHFITGALFGLVFGKKKLGWLITLICLSLYEIIENRFLVDIIFFRESAINWIWDILVGMIAFFIVSKILKNKKVRDGKINKDAMEKKVGK